jgi:hypothetical protein
MDFVSQLRNLAGMTTTENGAETHRSSGSKVLDLFASGGALRTRTQSDIEQIVEKAFKEDEVLTLKALFYLRDVRGGQGERKTFRIAMQWLAKNHAEALVRNLHNVPAFGRWDDLLCLLDTQIGDEVLTLIRKQFFSDMKAEKPSLLAKWMPSENASSKQSAALAKVLRERLQLTPRVYRQSLSSLRRKIQIVESKMCANEWNGINYSSVPSRASMIYRKAFGKHDETRYTEFLASVKKGEAKINAETLFPYDLVHKVRTGGYDDTIEAQWNALPNYMEKPSNALVMADTSGSMSGTPIEVALSLAIYIAERNVGPFHNLFMTFSDKPIIQELEGNNLQEKVRNIRAIVANTNIQAGFDRILELAIKTNATQEELPQTLFVISDMEFDLAVEGGTNFEAAKAKFEAAGYKLPEIVFWNVDSRNNQQPVKRDDKGVFLVSGCSPSILKCALNKQALTPYDMMLEVLGKPRYEVVR